MKNLRIITMFFVISLFSMQAYSQAIGWGGQFGYAKPQGDAFTDGFYESSLGVSYEADILFCPDFMSNKLGLGITYYGNSFFVDQIFSSVEIGLYRLSLYGVKGQYRFRNPDSKVSPYVSLGLGLTQFDNPRTTHIGGDVEEGTRSFSIGMRPEIGLDLGGFIISIAYLVPMHYDLESQSTTLAYLRSAGALTFSLGYRNYLSF